MVIDIQQDNKQGKYRFAMNVVGPESAKTQSAKSYLYTTLAKTHLGEVASVIVSTLISYGRLTSRDLSVRSKAPIKLVKSALVSLIQLNCISYWKEESSKQVFYSFNEAGLLIFLHSGDIINNIKLTYGEESAEIIQNILQVGHLKIEDYLHNIQDAEIKFNKERLILNLFNDGWLKRIQATHFYPLDDLWDKLYQETLKNTPRSSTISEIKRVNEAKETTRLKFTNVLESGNSAKELYQTQAGIKKLSPSLVVGFSLPRFEKHLRTRALVNLSKSRVGLLTCKVYEAALKLIEQNSPDLRHDFLKISGLINDPEEERIFVNSIENKLVDNKKIVFKVHDLVRMIPNELDLRNSILTHNFLKPSINHKKRVNTSIPQQPSKKVKLEDEEMDLDEATEQNSISIDDDLSFDMHKTDNSDPHSVSLINHHLKLLSSSSIPFLIEITPGTYTVPYTSLAKQLKKYNYDTLIKTTMGLNAFRILRCLKSLKLADEKTLSNSILLKDKTVRNELFKLKNLNMIEIQEVPRSADRAASKTFYLFRHKEFSAFNFLSNSLTYCMAEILQNIQMFKHENKILLEKCEREDVKGNEEELLLDSELKTLKNLQTREIINVGKFNRIKTLYEVFETI